MVKGDLMNRQVKITDSSKLRMLESCRNMDTASMSSNPSWTLGMIGQGYWCPYSYKVKSWMHTTPKNSISKTCTFDDFDSIRNKSTSISWPSLTWDASSRTNKSPHRPILLGTMHQVRWEEKGKRSWHSLCDDLPAKETAKSSNST